MIGVEVLSIRGTSDEALKMFMDKLPFLKPLKRITVFFDHENFLLTNYVVEHGISFVAEGINDKQIHLSSLNCGYTGTGPTATKELLYRIFISLGYEQGEADNWSNIAYNSKGFYVDFTGISLGSKKPKIRNCSFFRYEHITPVRTTAYFNIDNCSEVNTQDRRITMLNPHVNNLSGLLNALDIMQPRVLEFFIGNDSPLDNYYKFKFDILKIPYKGADITGVKHVNLIVKGKLFDIYCLVDVSVISGFVNMLHCKLLGYPYFREELFGQYSYLAAADSGYPTAGSFARFFKIMMAWLSVLKGNGTIHEIIPIKNILKEDY